MKMKVILLLVMMFLNGCSAVSIKKAEETTRLSAMTVPIVGGLIWAPIWVASKIVGDGSNSGKESHEIPGTSKGNEEFQAGSQL